MVSFRLEVVAPIFIGVGEICALTAKKKKIKDISVILIGFGILFMGMGLMSSSMKPVAELKNQKEICDKVHAEVEKAMNAKIAYMYGTMIEIPRATLVADEIAEVADFFSFGTNDLTQMTFGFSRDDVNAIIHEYQSKKILPADPFQTLDQEGVGQLVKLGVEKGRSSKASLKIGVCGEHGGDPASVEFFFRTGMNYVSCSPFRVPVARLAAAQAAVGM